MSERADEMANLYYRDDLTVGDFVVGARLELDGEEARHALRVARLRVGERTIIGNGRGAFAFGEVMSADRECLHVEVSRVEVHPAATIELVLVQALAKGDRDERAVEQATEFGVDRIVPWQAKRSVSRWSGSNPGQDKRAKGMAKWTRVAREAAKQSVRSRIPVVDELVSTEELCQVASAPGNSVLVLHPAGSARLSALRWNEEAKQTMHRVYLVVGPEGGIDDSELSALEEAGAKVLMLGETVLRTSSAGPAALAVLNVGLGRW